MKTIHKFILKSYFGPMILTFFIVMFVLIMQFMWRYIDELVGKGLSLNVILELMMYAAATLIPMGLPLATLLAAIMTMGNLGEHYELLALKSAGISLPRIIKPLTIVIVFISIGSFFVANNLVPYSMKKMKALIYDIRKQKQTIEFKDGIFFNGIENMSIRVGHQNPQTHLLTDVLIYDNSNYNKMTTTVADSGYIGLSADKRYLMVTLYNGQTYEESRQYNWYKENEFTRYDFDVQNAVIPLEGFDMERTDMSSFSNSQTRNVAELRQGIDSLEMQVNRSNARSYSPLMQQYLFRYDESLAQDTLPVHKVYAREMDAIASLDTSQLAQKMSVYMTAKSNAASSKSMFTFDEENAKEALMNLYRFKVEWHRKWSLPISILIFFLIGAPLGAIIRRGGLGMPIVVSVSFFVVYYVISITGEKMAREGTWDSFMGMWVSTFILMPIAVFLTYKATNDSNLLNAEWYYVRYKRARSFFHGLIKRKNKYD